MSEPQKQKVMYFASLTKLLLFKNISQGTDSRESVVLSVTVANESKVRFQLNNTQTKEYGGFSFYMVDLFPWIQEVIRSFETPESDKNIRHHEFRSQLPEYLHKAGKAKGANIVLSKDNQGPFIVVDVDDDNKSLKGHKFRFDPIPGVSMMHGPEVVDTVKEKKFVAYLKMLMNTVDNVSAYICAMNANKWTPPEDGVEIIGKAKPQAKATHQLPKDNKPPEPTNIPQADTHEKAGTKDNDIPF